MGKSATRVAFVCLTLVLISVDCSDSGTPRPAQPDDIVPVLVEAIHLNQALANEPDSLAAARTELLARHGWTEPELRAWLDANQGDVELWRKVVERVQGEMGKVGVDPVAGGVKGGR